MKWILACLLVSLGHLGSGQSLIPCEGQPTSYSGPPLPTLPQQFQTHVEANIVQKNITRNFAEYIDYPGNRGVIISYNKTSQETMRTVLNLNEQEARIVFENKTCKFLKTNTSSRFFGMMTGGNGTHLVPIKDLLYFGEEKGEVFIDGDKKVRGIAVNHWRTCVKMPHTDGNFTLDYYFSKGSGYLMDGVELQLPVRAVINGTGKSMHRNGTVTGDYHSFYHVYEFFDFKPDISHDPRIFEVPVGVICNQGDMTENKPVPEISTQFTAGIEKVMLNNGQERDRHALQLYLDFSAQILRLDADRPIGDRGRPISGSRPLIYISDFKQGLQYVIDKLEKNCTVSKDVSPPGGRGNQMPPPSLMIDFFQDFSSFIYQGQKSWRGLPVYSWGFYNSSSKERTEILFHQPQTDGTIKPGPSVMEDIEPVGVFKASPSRDGSQGEISTYEHMYGFSNGHPDPDVFDVSVCYALDHHSTYLAFDVTGRNARQVIRFHQKEFISKMRQTIAGAAKVSVTRIASIKWEEAKSSNTDTRLLVTFQLLDNKLSGIDNTEYIGPSLSEAITNLQKSINSGSGLVFNVVLSTQQTVRFSILEGSLWEIYSGPTSESQPSNMLKYGAGSMAGLAIGMLVIGALLGLAAAYIIYKKIDTSVPYKITE